MKIGELARRTAVSERSLRYYEEQGAGGGTHSRRSPDLCGLGRRSRHPHPGAAGRRAALSGDEGSAAVHARSRRGPAATATPWLTSRLRTHRSRLDSQMAELRRTREVLDDVIRSAEGPSCAWSCRRPPDRGPRGGAWSSRRIRILLATDVPECGAPERWDDARPRGHRVDADPSRACASSGACGSGGRLHRPGLGLLLRGDPHRRPRAVCGTDGVAARGRRRLVLTPSRFAVAGRCCPAVAPWRWSSATACCGSPPTTCSSTRPSTMSTPPPPPCS